MGFRRINSSDLIGLEIVGRTITQDPEGEDHFEIKSIHENGYVTAYHSNGKSEIKMFPDEKLIAEKWWIKK